MTRSNRCAWCHNEFEPHHSVQEKDHQLFHAWVCIDAWTLYCRFTLRFQRTPNREEMSVYLAHVARIGYVPPTNQLPDLSALAITAA